MISLKIQLILYKVYTKPVRKNNPDQGNNLTALPVNNFKKKNYFNIMCIAILNKKDLLPDEVIVNSWENNSHGGGLLWVENQELKVFKELKNLDIFLSTYKRVRANTDSVILIHCRIATAGQVNESNCHPFLNNDKTFGFIHNGMITNLSDYNSEKSDTHKLRDIIANIKGIEISLDVFKEIMQGTFHKTFNKFIFLNNNNEYLIINEDSGVWENDNWFSNTSHKRSHFSGDYYSRNHNLFMRKRISLEKNLCEYCENPSTILKSYQGSFVCKKCYKELSCSYDRYFL